MTKSDKASILQLIFDNQHSLLVLSAVGEHDFDDKALELENHFNVAYPIFGRYFNLKLVKKLREYVHTPSRAPTLNTHKQI